jgi:hypothetical protein
LNAGLSQARQAGVPVTLGEPMAIRTDDQRHMTKLWCWQAKRLVQQDLPRRGGDQVVTADDLRDAHRRVIDHHS